MKKTKLLLSLAMMCLSVAVLCFGVLAATSVTYSISGTISYEVSDVFVKINTRVFGVAAQQDKATVIANVKTLESKALGSIADSTYKLTQTMVEYDSSSATTDPSIHTAQTSDSKGVEIVYGTYYTYYIVINIQNLSSSKAVDAIITDNTTAELNSIKTTNLYLNNVEYGTPKNIVIAYSIKDKTQGIDSTAAKISYSLKVSYETTDYKNPIEVTNDTTNGYYYVTLGTGKALTGEDNDIASENSAIKWRLVSLGGMSKYTYNSSDAFEARYLSDAVFLQETAVNSGLAFDTSNSQNYYTSTLRNGTTDQAALKDGSYFNLSSTDTSFIKARDLGERLYKFLAYYYNQSNNTVKESTYVERPSTDTTKDKFWLLDHEELELFMGGLNPSSLLKWINSDNTNGVAYLLRSPSSISSSYVCPVGSSGQVSYGVYANQVGFRGRAAFQLA